MAKPSLAELVSKSQLHSQRVGSSIPDWASWEKSQAGWPWASCRGPRAPPRGKEWENHFWAFSTWKTLKGTAISQNWHATCNFPQLMAIPFAVKESTLSSEVVPFPTDRQHLESGNSSRGLIQISFLTICIHLPKVLWSRGAGPSMHLARETAPQRCFYSLGVFLIGSAPGHSARTS